ncbi:hypothetical protein KKE34_00800 [Patescibacteria group bacterium]|nr:hypothetical protein [Patescibacteria group bacterium]MBU1885128.1 hypothetical protein [Patescibacteria group bacterium]
MPRAEGDNIGGRTHESARAEFKYLVKSEQELHPSLSLEKAEERIRKHIGRVNRELFIYLHKYDLIN